MVQRREKVRKRIIRKGELQKEEGVKAFPKRVAKEAEGKVKLKKFIFFNYFSHSN